MAFPTRLRPHSRQRDPIDADVVAFDCQRCPLVEKGLAWNKPSRNEKSSPPRHPHLHRSFRSSASHRLERCKRPYSSSYPAIQTGPGSPSISRMMAHIMPELTRGSANVDILSIRTASITGHVD